MIFTLNLCKIHRCEWLIHVGVYRVPRYKCSFIRSFACNVRESLENLLLIQMNDIHWSHWNFVPSIFINKLSRSFFTSFLAFIAKCHKLNDYFLLWAYFNALCEWCVCVCVRSGATLYANEWKSPLRLSLASIRDIHVCALRSKRAIPCTLSMKVYVNYQRVANPIMPH